MKILIFLILFVTSCIGESKESRQLRELKGIEDTLEEMKKDLKKVKDLNLYTGNMQSTALEELMKARKILEESKKIDELSNELRKAPLDKKGS